MTESTTRRKSRGPRSRPPMCHFAPSEPRSTRLSLLGVGAVSLHATRALMTAPFGHTSTESNHA